MAAKKAATTKRSASSKVANERNEGDTGADGDKAASFESAMAEIESIVVKLESGELDLTSSLQQYEQGVKRLRQCHQILEVAEQKVSLLSGFDADGNPVTEPLPDTQFRGANSEAVSGTTKLSKGGSSPQGGGSGRGGAGRVDDSAGLF